MDRAKIQLSEEELRLVQNAEVLLTKNRIIGKVYQMFGMVAENVQEVLSHHHRLHPDILEASPKISRGENYQGLPYVMLDYPRCFGKTDSFAIRVMFWWGNFFSVTLHLKGKYKNEIAPILLDNLHLLVEQNFFISISTDEWRHDFESDNYMAVRDADSKTINDHLVEKEFCKIAAKIDLDDWEKLPSLLLRKYEVLLTRLAINFQGDETGL